jgi:predicted transcriptional regulator of viral defense system
MLEKIRKAILAFPAGSPFTTQDLLRQDLGSRTAIDQALSRLARDGVIRRLARGLYYRPEEHPALGELTPQYDLIAKAAARKTGSKLLMSGALAANRLGLSDQIPAKTIFYTDGPSRKLNLGGAKIELRHAGPRRMASAETSAGTIIEALRELGPKHANETTGEALSYRLDSHTKNELREHLHEAPEWIKPILRKASS